MVDGSKSNNNSTAKMQYLRKCGAEFLGTYILMVAIGGNVIAGNTHPGFAGISIAMVLVVMLYAKNFLILIRF